MTLAKIGLRDFSMPPLAYWFSGAALAAFIAFAGSIGLLGYSWYRAALTEMQSAATKSGRAKFQKDLSAFIVSGDSLLARLMIPTDEAAGLEAKTWNEAVIKYVNDNLGPGYAARLNSGAGITGFVQQAPEPVRNLHRSTYVRLIRLHEFLKEEPG
jgi:hypothetical protein